MFNVEEMNAHLANAVKDAVAAEAQKLQGGMAINDLIASIWKKPIMSFPDDVGVVLKTGRTSTFALRDDPDFPPLIQVGNKRFVSSEKLMAFLMAKEVAA